MLDFHGPDHALYSSNVASMTAYLNCLPTTFYHNSFIWGYSTFKGAVILQPPH